MVNLFIVRSLANYIRLITCGGGHPGQPVSNTNGIVSEGLYNICVTSDFRLPQIYSSCLLVKPCPVLDNVRPTVGHS